MSRAVFRYMAIGLMSVLVVACGGGGDAANLDGSTCTEKKAHQRTGSDEGGWTEWECYELIDGQLVWRKWLPEGYPDQIENQMKDAKPDTNADVDLVGTSCNTRGEHINNASSTVEYECYYNPDGSLAWQVFLDAKVDPRPMKYHWSDGICDEREPEIKFALTPNPDDISFIMPLGLLSPKHVTPISHSYVQFKNTLEAANDIIAPADGYIVRVEGMPGDYGMVLQLSCDVYVQYGHLDKLVGPVAEFDNTQMGYGKGKPAMRVAVKAGEVVAKAGEIRTDWQMSDQRVTLPGLQPRNYVRHDFWKVHSVSALEYLPSEIAAKLLPKVMRQQEPRLGKIDYDVANTASGVWFVKDTNYYLGQYGDEDMPYVNFSDTKGYWDTHMSIVPAGLDPSVTLLGKGLSTSKGSAVFAFRDSLDATSIKSGDAPKVFELVDFSYQSPDGKDWDPNDQSVRFTPTVKIVKGTQTVAILVVQVTGESTLRAELRPGADASKSPEFTNAAQDFER